MTCIRTVRPIQLLTIGACLLNSCQRPNPRSREDSADNAPEVVSSPPSEASPSETSPSPPPSPTVTPSQAEEGRPSADEATQSKYFDNKWISSKRRVSEAQQKKALALEARGHALYRQKKDVDAIELYEAALSEWTNPTTYERYANSLSNVDRLRDAVRAYGWALQLMHPQPERVLYNRACALSRLGDLHDAEKDLKEAVLRGYSATSKLETDPDLANLRAQPLWKERLETMRTSVQALVGEFRTYDDRDRNEFYLLCPGGDVSVNSEDGVDGSCCQATYYGVLEERDDAFVAVWHSKCGATGQGNKQSTHNWPYVPCQPYASCSKEITCRAVDDGRTNTLFTRAALPFVTETAFRDNYDPGDRAYVASQPAPAACKEAAEQTRRFRKSKTATPGVPSAKTSRTSPEKP